MNAPRLTMVVTTLLLMFTGAGNASNLLTNGDFLNPIGIGACGTNNWCDWTNVGITANPAPSPIPGNYASLPNTSNNGADLFQDISTLAPGTYKLSFFAQDASTRSAELVFGLNQALGAPTSFAFPAGWQTEILLSPSTTFSLETLTFIVANSEPYTPNEITFSQSYDAAVDEISNSKNPPGTVVNIANVSLTAVTPLPSTWIMFITGFVCLGAFAYRARKRLTI